MAKGVTTIGLKNRALKRVIGHIDTVAKLGRIGTIYSSLTPYTPYYYNRDDIRFSFKPNDWLSINDKVEFTIEKIGDKHYARNITFRIGKPIRPFIMKYRMFNNHWPSMKYQNYWPSIKSQNIKKSQSNINYDKTYDESLEEQWQIGYELTDFEMETAVTSLENNEYIDEYQCQSDIINTDNTLEYSNDMQYDNRIRASLAIHPTKRTHGIVISEMKDYFGWILCNVSNSLPIRYHITQIQAIGVKRLTLHSRVEFNVIAGKDHDWAFYITKPGGNLITYEKPDIYGQWLRSLEFYGRRMKDNKNSKIYKGFVCEYSLNRQIGFIVPFDELNKRYMFHIDNCNIAKCENRRVFMNDCVTFQLLFNENKNKYYAININSLYNSNGIIHGKHLNWSTMLPYNRKYSYSSHYLHNCVDKLDENERYKGLVEFNAYDMANMYNAKIYFDDVKLYPRTLNVSLNELQCSDIKYIERGTRVEFSLNIDRHKRIITSVRNITGPNGMLLTYLKGERGEFYRWRNINCEIKLKSIYEEFGEKLFIDNMILVGFIRDINVEGTHTQSGIIEIISYNACYEPVFFYFSDLLFENRFSTNIKVATMVQFNVIMNGSIVFDQNTKENNNGCKWTTDPRFYLTMKAINIVSYKCDKYINGQPMFTMNHLECINNKAIAT